jgi:peptidoglycan/LPS O-acetylase OafA/YrhL
VRACPNCGNEIVQLTTSGEELPEPRLAAKKPATNLIGLWIAVAILIGWGMKELFENQYFGWLLVLGCVMVITAIIALLVNTVRKRGLRVWWILLGVGLVPVIMGVTAPLINETPKNLGALFAIIVFICLFLCGIIGAWWVIRKWPKPDETDQHGIDYKSRRKTAVTRLTIIGVCLLVDILIIVAILATWE